MLDIPLERETYLCINFILGTKPISVPPYRMAQVEIKKLIEQLKGYTIQGFYSIEYLSMGASVLCIKKKDGSLLMCIIIVNRIK